MAVAVPFCQPAALTPRPPSWPVPALPVHASLGPTHSVSKQVLSLRVRHRGICHFWPPELPPANVTVACPLRLPEGSERGQASDGKTSPPLLSSLSAFLLDWGAMRWGAGDRPAGGSWGEGEAFAIRWKNDQVLKSQVDKSAKSLERRPVPSRGYSKHRRTKHSGNYISEEDAKYFKACLVLIHIRGNFMIVGFTGSKLV